MGKISEQIYSAIISHANTNIKTVGISLFDDLEEIDSQIAEIQDINNIAKYAYIESLQKRKDYILSIYAKNNHLI